MAEVEPAKEVTEVTAPVEAGPEPQEAPEAAAAPEAPRLLFVVSHVERLKARVEAALAIKVGPAGSHVRNTTPRGLCVAQEAAPADVPDLVPDEDKPGCLWCRFCGQSIRSAQRRRHLESGKHGKNKAKPRDGREK